MRTKDQPSGATVKETPRPPDKSVVTDELVPPESGQAQAAAADPPAGSKDGDSDPPNDDNAPTDDNAPAKSRRGPGRKIRRLQRQLKAVQGRDQANTRKIGELEQEIQQLKTAQSAEPARPEPQLKDFPNPATYAKAWAKWEKASEPAAAAADHSSRSTKPNTRTPDADPAPAPPEPPDPDDLQDFAEQGKKRLGDRFFEAQEAARESEFVVNKFMGDYLLESDHGPELFTYLAENPDESLEIFEKDNPNAGKAMKALERKAAAGKLLVSKPLDGTDDQAGDEDSTETAPPKPPRGRTRAPDPPSGSRERGTNRVAADPENESMDDYAERRAKEESQRLQHH